MHVQEKTREISALLARLISAGGIKLTAHYECLGQQTECTIDSSWKFHGVKIETKSLSFTASKNGLAICFSVAHEYFDAFMKWVDNLADKVTEGIETVVKATIVFMAGVVELKKEAATAA
jgi:hypothetical protein